MGIKRCKVGEWLERAGENGEWKIENGEWGSVVIINFQGLIGEYQEYHPLNWVISDLLQINTRFGFF